MAGLYFRIKRTPGHYIGGDFNGKNSFIYRPCVGPGFLFFDSCNNSRSVYRCSEEAQGINVYFSFIVYSGFITAAILGGVNETRKRDKRGG